MLLLRRLSQPVPLALNHDSGSICHSKEGSNMTELPKPREGFHEVHKHLSVLLTYMKGLKEFDYEDEDNTRLILAPPDKPTWTAAIDVMEQLKEIIER